MPGLMDLTIQALLEDFWANKGRMVTKVTDIGFYVSISSIRELWTALGLLISDT